MRHAKTEQLGYESSNLLFTEDVDHMKLRLNHLKLNNESIRRDNMFLMINSVAVSGDNDGLSNQERFSSHMSDIKNEEVAPYLTSILDAPETPIAIERVGGKDFE